MARMMYGDAMRDTPPRMKEPTRRALVATRSASQPPAPLPTEIPASTQPITAEKVSRVRPTYGAITRAATTSLTSTIAEDARTRSAPKAHPTPTG
jgi:hypothetical protein